MAIDLKVGLENRDQLHFKASEQNGELSDVQIKAIGCMGFLELVDQWRSKIQGPIGGLEIPKGNDHGEMLLRELILRLQGKWQPPYTDEELCHCRVVATRVVDEAIVCGADTAAVVARQTSAGTGCGTCRPDIEKLIAYRRN